MTSNMLRGPIAGAVFESLLRGLVPAASTAGMTSTGFRYRKDFPALAKPFLVQKQKVRRWPGVVIPPSGPAVRLYTFAYVDSFVDLLLSKCDDLFGFQEVAMPDNLHVLSPEGRVLLGSVTLDGSAWTDMTPAEWHAFAAGRAPLSTLAMEAVETPEFDRLWATSEPE